MKKPEKPKFIPDMQEENTDTLVKVIAISIIIIIVCVIVGAIIIFGG